MFWLYAYLLASTSNMPLVERPFMAQPYYSMQDCEAARDEADALWGEFKRKTGFRIKFKFVCE